jgi:L-aminopeptidase/D-esterase-like protein
MAAMIELVEGVRVGHWTQEQARTGCTVVLLPDGTVASGEVRGGAPASREFALLAPERSVDRVHAVCLSGGSAFGLAACDGVLTELESAGIGYPTPAGPVPIVVGLSLYDLTTGDGSVRPGPEQGARATSAAEGGAVAVGRVGAGTGATVGKWDDPADAAPGGIGLARVEHDGVVVMALLAVNAAGWIDDRSGRAPRPGHAPFGGNTTIGVVVTDAPLDKVACLQVAQGGHDGLARALVPAHTGRDGDALVAAATGAVSAEIDVDLVRWMAATAVERAVRSLL